MCVPLSPRSLQGRTRAGPSCSLCTPFVASPRRPARKADTLLIDRPPPADLTTLVQHTIPPLLPRQPITPLLAFHYTIDVLVLSSAGGNLVDALFLSLRAALADLRVPVTRNVAFEASLLGGDEGESDMAGIKQAALGGKTKKKGGEQGRKAFAAGAEFELVDSTEDGERLASEVREALPVCITLHIVRFSLSPLSLSLCLAFADAPSLTGRTQLPNGTHLLDPTPAEALACPAHLLVFVSSAGGPKGTLAGLRLIGSAELGLGDMRRLTEVRWPSLSFALVKRHSRLNALSPFLLSRPIQAGRDVGLSLIAATNAQLDSQSSTMSASAAATTGGLGFFGS